MIYQVTLHYYKYTFSEPEDAMKFARMAARAADDKTDVDITVIAEEEDRRR